MKKSTDAVGELVATALVFIVGFIGTLALAVACSAIMAFPTMWMWNYLFTDATSIIGTQLPVLDFLHAWCLNLLLGLWIPRQVHNQKK